MHRILHADRRPKENHKEKNLLALHQELFPLKEGIGLILNQGNILSVPEYVIKKGRPHGHRYGKKPGDKEYYLSNQLKKKCQKREFQGIHDRFLHDQTFRIRMLKIIETKTFVDDGMLLRMKITLTIWQYRSTSTKRTNGGFIQISKVPVLCHWDIDLISSRHCLPCNDCDKKQEKNHTCLLILTSTNNGRHKVHLLHGGIGKVPGGLLKIQKVKKEVSQVLSERGDPFLAEFGKNLRKRLSRIQFILYQIGRLQLTASTVTDGRCKDNTSNDPFSRRKSVQ